MFPVNAWLPASYHAPPFAISALMGGLLTKVGIYALLRTLVMLLPVAREHLAPVLLGTGVRLFDHLGTELRALEILRVVDTPQVTHLRYRVVK